MLRPTPADPRGVEQHHWNTEAEENQQLNPGGLSNRQIKLQAMQDAPPLQLYPASDKFLM